MSKRAHAIHARTVTMNTVSETGLKSLVRAQGFTGVEHAQLRALNLAAALRCAQYNLERHQDMQVSREILHLVRVARMAARA